MLPRSPKFFEPVNLEFSKGVYRIGEEKNHYWSRSSNHKTSELQYGHKDGVKNYLFSHMFQHIGTNISPAFKGPYQKIWVPKAYTIFNFNNILSGIPIK